MKKAIIISAVSAIVLVSTLSIISIFNRPPELSALELANVEALSDNESGGIIGMCDTHCIDRAGYICILHTNYGFDINCDEMVPWTSF